MESALPDNRGRTSFRERTRQLREAEIVDAARQLLGERGYHEMSMDEVAARVGISKATLYAHFSSKEDLVLTVIGRQMDTFIDHLEAAQSGEASPIARLAAVLRLLVELRHAHACFNPSVEDVEVFHLVQRRADFLARMERGRRLLGNLVEQARRAGEINPALSTGVITAALLALALAPHYRHELASGHLSVHELAEALATLFLHGVRAAPRERNVHG